MNTADRTPNPVLLWSLIQDGQWDRALDAGLMEYTPTDILPAPLDPHALTQIMSLQQQFRSAWSARARYRARTARLAASKQEEENIAVTYAKEQGKTPLPLLAAQLLAQAQAEADPAVKEGHDDNTRHTALAADGEGLDEKTSSHIVSAPAPTSAETTDGVTVPVSL